MDRITTAIRQRIFILLMKNSKVIQSDRLYVFLFYLFATGRILSFKNPQRYSEKLQLLKVIKNTDPQLGNFVDKLKVRSIVSNLIGDKYLNEVYSVYSSSEEIDFNALPYPCVLKTTHDSGTVFPLIKKPDQSTILEIQKILKSKLAINYFWKGRETPYKYATPKIICEKFLIDSGFDTPVDYKFFCFYGSVKLLQVTIIKEKVQYVNYFNETLEPIELKSGNYTNCLSFKLPERISEMSQLATSLSQKFCHVRVDFYNINNQPIFGEFTFHSDGGLLIFSDDSYDLILGKNINCC